MTDEGENAARAAGAATRHYEFGKNWQRFLKVLNAERISAAEQSLKRMLHVEDLTNLRFLDIGSGSGLFSLAARNLGASVHSFDFDQDSVACTEALKKRYFPGDDRWVVERGSILDVGYLHQLGTFDVVYAWGVVHHTGAMWQALENALIPVVDHGKLFIAVYNDQGKISEYWSQVKRAYTHYPYARPLITCMHIPVLACMRLLPRLLSGRLPSERGMALWYDLKDWLGGYPFEVATPEAIIAFFRDRGCFLLNFGPCADPAGNNEFVFICTQAESTPHGRHPAGERANRQAGSEGALAKNDTIADTGPAFKNALTAKDV